MKKNMFQMLGLALVLGLVLAGCQNAADAGATSSGGSVKKLPPPTNVNFYIGVEGQASTEIDRVALAFKAPTDDEYKPTEVSYQIWIRQKEKKTPMRVLASPIADTINYIVAPNFLPYQGGGSAPSGQGYLPSGVNIRDLDHGNAYVWWTDSATALLASPYPNGGINMVARTERINLSQDNRAADMIIVEPIDQNALLQLENKNSGHRYAFWADPRTQLAGGLGNSLDDAFSGLPFESQEEIEFGVQTILANPAMTQDYYTVQIWYEKYDGTLPSDIVWATNNTYKVK